MRQADYVFKGDLSCEVKQCARSRHMNRDHSSKELKATAKSCGNVKLANNSLAGEKKSRSANAVDSHLIRL